jgi:hypothetical protein
VAKFIMSIGAGVGGGSNSWEVTQDCTFLGGQAMNKDMSVLVTNGFNFPGLPATNTPVSPDDRYIYCLSSVARGQQDVKIPLRRGDRLYFYFSAEGAIICHFDDFPAEQ